MLKKTFFIIIIFLLFSCDFGDYDNYTKIYSGSYGYDVAYRVDGNKVYSGSYGYNVAYRIDGNRIYSGPFGYNVAYRVCG